MSGMPPHVEAEAKWPKKIDALAAPARARPLQRQYIIVWYMVLVLLYWHAAAVYGLYRLPSTHWATVALNSLVYISAGLGVTAGAHRLWSHRSYKAKLPLQILLMLMHSCSTQQPAFQWARDHRVHHKYTDTDADPHNSNRGFFYSHFGWLLVKKHPDVISKAKNIDLSDLANNPVLNFQRKYYFILSGLLSFALPTLMPMYFWQESLTNAWHVSMLRLVLGTHCALAINSVAHLFGNKPYDKDITSTEYEPLSLTSFGEGYHNFHHIFPYDYRNSELGNSRFQISKWFIDFCVKVGWAYDLKYASDDMILKRALRTGDGTHTLVKANAGEPIMQEEAEENIWGWGDEDMTEQERFMLSRQNIAH